WCSEQLLGRVLNGFGHPIDGKGPLVLTESRRLDNRAVAPMSRENIRRPIATGLRAVDGLHTCGLGQRMGIFAGPGVGKSTLMSSIAKNTSADISVVALIGERGREVGARGGGRSPPRRPRARGGGPGAPPPRRPPPPPPATPRPRGQGRHDD